jgi:NAD(P)-dependent dehydrogenase (short-subunit alcohol dehydrogenase family)
VTGGAVHEIRRETWQEVIDINLTGVWQSVKAVVPHMIERQQGSIVIISSVNGLEGGSFSPQYTAAKFGLVGLMKSIALQLGPHGIRANSVHPGAILTDMTNNQDMYDRISGHEGGTYDEYLAGGKRYGILKGSGYLPPEVIADATLFLNSALASNITGISLPVDSGHLAMPGINLDPKE